MIITFIVCLSLHVKFDTQTVVFKDTQRIRSRFDGEGASGGGAVSAPPNDDGAT